MASYWAHREETNLGDSQEESVADDLSIIPLEKDGFALCELCGRVGRRTLFYQRNNKFCSLRCHRSSLRKKYIWKFQTMESSDHMAGMIPLEPLPQLQTWHASFSDLQAGPIKQSAAIVANSYEWKDELFGCDFLAAPVSLFKHAPLHEMWENTIEGLKVEVKNTDCENYSEKLGDYFWVATVLKVKGYMGLLRYEGFGSDDSKDFWVNLCCSEVHPVGWCATRGKPLIPPRTIEDKYTDWKKFLVKQLTGARTLPANFYSILNDNLKSRFSVGTVMEVVDKNRISQVKVASVHEIVGKRLHVRYYDSSPEDNGFWCHEDSPLIHPVGWAFRVGHHLDAPPSYLQRVAAGRLLPNDAVPDMFHKYPSTEPPLFAEGMKLEAIDPLNLSSVCAATVMKILSEGYMMIRIDCYPAEATGADWFCYHQRSPCIFPVGFALANKIALVPPSGFSPTEFNWADYLQTCEGPGPAGRELFAARGHLVSHGFVAGMRLECADLMDPRLVCVATIARVVADLLKVHFDGWGDEYDQWLWAHSTDMYPVGWCRAVGHRLEGPLQPPPRPPRPARKTRSARPPKRRKRPPAPQAVQPPATIEESSQNSDIADMKSLSPLTSVSEMSADVDTRHSEMSADVDTRHSEMSADVDTRHSEMSADVDTRHSEMSADVDTRHSEISADVDTRHSEISADVDTRLSETSEQNSDCVKMDVEEAKEDLEEKPDAVNEAQPTLAADSPVIHHSFSTSMSSLNMEVSHYEFSDVVMAIQDGGSFYFRLDVGRSINTAATTKYFMLIESISMEPTEKTDESSHDVSLDTASQMSPGIQPVQDDNDKVIPRLVNNASVPLEVFNSVDPENWQTADVAKFLTVNDCKPYCVNFTNITGPMMLQLTKDEIIELLEMKVGPSLKIFDLIQQLKCKIKQPQNRLMGSFNK